MNENSLISRVLLNQELLCLIDGHRSALVCGMDVESDQVMCRWLADGRMVTFKLRPEDFLLSLDEIDEKLKPAVAEWHKTKPFEGDVESEYLRLRSFGPNWCEVSRG